MNRPEAHIVIGANYGDEGKGVLTDYLARKLDAVAVARFNGGAQAGHTVQHEDGRRHVFGHLSAGTMHGAATVLGQRFVLNPFMLSKELNRLTGAGFKVPSISAHLRAPVSTIYDMITNMLVETKRGDDRHGSCGVGINETVTRHSRGVSTSLEILSCETGAIENTLRDIHQVYLPMRLAELGLTPVEFDSFARSKWSVDPADYAAHAKAMQRGLIPVSGLNTAAGIPGPLVFEGAQGLALDELMGTFPYVTRSLTGLPYALELAKQLGITEIHPVYVTRAYLTRHGAGPLRGGCAELNGISVVDETNVANPWQGTMRFAELDTGALAQRINEDMTRGKAVAHLYGLTLHEPKLAVTCMDQLSDRVPVNHCGLPLTTSPNKLLQKIEAATNVKVAYTSHGPTWRTIQEV